MSPAKQLVPNADAWRLSPAGFARKIHHLEWPPHLRLLSQVLVLVATGRIKRLAVSLPPGHSKSHSIMRVFPAWYLDLWPSHQLIGASYGASLAVGHGRFARDSILANQSSLRVRFPNEGNYAEDWHTTLGGGFRTAGIDGSIIGRRGHGGLGDDLHRGHARAHSAADREHVWDFWTGDMRSRLYPGAFLILDGTRYHEDDVLGRTRKNDHENDWTFLVMPAIAEGDEDLDAVLSRHTCERLRKEGVSLPEWSRKSGEALWPVNVDSVTGERIQWFDLEELVKVRREVLEYKWSSLYQQHPSPPSGEMFPISAWERTTEIPPKTPMYRRWDLAATKDGGDETAGGLVTRDEHGYTYIVDIVHGRWGDAEVEDTIRRTAQADAAKYGKRVVHIIEQEPGASGAAWARRIIREVLAGYRVEAERPQGDKPSRARPLAAQQQAGMVRLVTQVNPDDPDGDFRDPPWVDFLTEQARAFPSGAHDDLVDCISGAFNRLVGHGSSKVRVSSAAKRRVGVRQV